MGVSLTVYRCSPVQRWRRLVGRFKRQFTAFLLLLIPMSVLVLMYDPRPALNDRVPRTSEEQWHWSEYIDCSCASFTRHSSTKPPPTARYREPPGPGPIVNGSSPTLCRHPILTMFTSMQLSDVRRGRVHYNTIQNWAGLGSCVRTLMFINESESESSELVKLARKQNWIIKGVPRTFQGIPVLKSMFLSSFQYSSTPLYLYANSDILFDVSLIQTTRSILCSVLAHSKVNPPLSTSDQSERSVISLDNNNSIGIFAVGRRVNINATDVKSATPSDITKSFTGWPLFLENAEDYFITTSGNGVIHHNSEKTKRSCNKNCETNPLPENIKDNEDKNSPSGRKNNCSDVICNESVPTANSSMVNTIFRWENVPEFVIGRPGYDNWLVAEALKRKVTWSIDVSSTVLAVHQTGSDGVKSGWNAPEHNVTLMVNRALAGTDYNYFSGRTFCLPWMSKVALDDRVTIVRREKFPEICSKTFKVLNRNKKVEEIRKSTTGELRVESVASNKTKKISPVKNDRL